MNLLNRLFLCAALFLPSLQASNNGTRQLSAHTVEKIQHLFVLSDKMPSAAHKKLKSHVNRIVYEEFDFNSAESIDRYFAAIIPDRFFDGYPYKGIVGAPFELSLIAGCDFLAVSHYIGMWGFISMLLVGMIVLNQTFVRPAKLDNSHIMRDLAFTFLYQVPAVGLTIANPLFMIPFFFVTLGLEAVAHRKAKRQRIDTVSGALTSHFAFVAEQPVLVPQCFSKHHLTYFARPGIVCNADFNNGKFLESIVLSIDSSYEGIKGLSLPRHRAN